MASNHFPSYNSWVQKWKFDGSSDNRSIVRSFNLANNHKYVSLWDFASRTSLTMTTSSIFDILRTKMLTDTTAGPSNKARGGEKLKLRSKVVSIPEWHVSPSAGCDHDSKQHLASFIHFLERHHNGFPRNAKRWGQTVVWLRCNAFREMATGDQFFAFRHRRSYSFLSLAFAYTENVDFIVNFLSFMLFIVHSSTVSLKLFFFDFSI